jgi:hypothetical protein
MDPRPLPSVEDLLYLRRWWQAACPAAHSEISALRAVRTLGQLLENLPAHIPQYVYGNILNPDVEHTKVGWKALAVAQRRVILKLQRRLRMMEDEPKVRARAAGRFGQLMAFGDPHPGSSPRGLADKWRIAAATARRECPGFEDEADMLDQCARELSEFLNQSADS